MDICGNCNTVDNASYEGRKMTYDIWVYFFHNSGYFLHGMDVYTSRLISLQIVYLALSHYSGEN